MKSNKNSIRHLIRVLFATLGVFILILSFQNCGKGAFEVRVPSSLQLASLSSELDQLRSEDLDDEETSDILDPNSVDEIKPFTGGTTYYVCDSASDCGSGWATGSDSRTASQATSKSSPWKTIDYAVGKALPGDLIVVGSGIYNTIAPGSASNVVIKRGGTSAKYLSIKSEKKWGAIVDANRRHSGFFLDCDIQASYVRIDGFVIRNANGFGVYTRDHYSPYTQCSNIELTNLKIHNVGHSGISMISTRNSMVANSLIYAIGSMVENPNGNLHHGIYISDHTEDVLLKNNIVYNCKFGWPVHIYDGHQPSLGPAINHKVINNTLIGDNPNRKGGIVLWGSGHIIRNNLIYERAGFSNTYKGAIADRNISFSGTVIQNNITNLEALCQNGCRGSSFSGNLLSVSTSSGDFSGLAILVAE